ncbi:biotin-dependent carboxyltransferase family protein [Mucilaginibacter sp. OK098]|uniref:5-oxoprolinase subunit C family protein n=1 Tax=Mucilaginibacter sp. OK098 TaxID=1855297 RepID=UPI00091E7CBA|nr:biotin-dependent carboxyltransferase family protein [Mucilaginibacter sp. OK098]SHN21310.1 antagonist of KipI [Mucilaginibacter sp. OK098]
MQIRILKPGLMSTIQDLGRYQYLSQAVPVCGAMDTLSARIANKAVGNEDNAAVIEFTYADAEFVSETDLLIAYAGDGAILKSGEQELPCDRPLFIPSGTFIKLTNNPSGCRTYLAIAGGWDVPEILGSRSTFLIAGFGGMDGRVLKKGDTLKNEATQSVSTQKIFKSLNYGKVNYPEWSIPRQLLLPADRKAIRVVPANEFGWFNSRSTADFMSASHIIGRQSNRMGYHLEGVLLHRVKHHELLSTAVTPGTIQVTGSGSLVLLMADCQTTGGYPRIAKVAAVDMPLCGQLKPGDALNFKEIGLREAEMLYIEREQHLQQLTTAVQTKYL